MNVGEVYFALRGDSFEPDEVSRALGVVPTRVSCKASPVPKCSSWVLSSGEVTAEVVDVYELGESVLGQLFGRAEAIRDIAEALGLTVTLQVVLTVSPDDRVSTPAIGFSADSIRFLASVNAAIDVDTYRGSS